MTEQGGGVPQWSPDGRWWWDGERWHLMHRPTATLPSGLPVVPYGERPPVEHRFAWLLAASPLAYLLLEAVLGGTDMDSSAYRPAELVIMIVVLGVLAAADARELRRAGYKLGSWMCGVILVPLYLVVRTIRVKQVYVLPAVWVTAFVLTMPSVGVLAHTVGVRMLGSKVSAFVTSQVQEVTDDPYARVICPAHPRVRPGHTFRCAVTGAQTQAVDVEVLDNIGHYRWIFAHINSRS